MRPRVALVVMLVVASLAGCIGSSGDADPAGDIDDDTVNNSTPPTNTSSVAVAHVHDRWDGQDTRTVVDRTVTTGATTDVDPTDPTVESLQCTFTCGSQIEFAPEEGRIVPPGTSSVDLTASWSGSPPPEHDVWIYGDYMAANMTEWHDLPASRVPNGEPVAIDTTVEMADGGHAEQSLWKFRFFVLYCQTAAGSGCMTRFSTDELSVDVNVTAHRSNGSLPVEPPHPDWYGNSTSRTVLTDEGSTTGVGAGEWYTEPTGCTLCRGEGFYFGGDHKPVPPGTKVLAANVTWSNEAPTSDAASIRPYVLYASSGFDFHAMEAAVQEDGRWVFELPVLPNQTDGMYVENRSRWQFTFGFEGVTDTGVDDPVLGTDVTNPWVFDGSWHLDIQAYNTTETPTPSD